MTKIVSVFKREVKAYFDSPVAYVFLTAFLVLLGFLTFGWAMFYERRQADLTPFFFWHPWVYLLLIPAATMGVWADERRNGTAELLLSLPITLMQALIGKFLAAWAFLTIGLLLTFPIALTAGYLGAPDWGVVFCGYFGSWLLAGAAAAVGVFASAISRSSIVGFVISLVLTFALLIIGFDPLISSIAGWGVPTVLTDALAGCSLLTHFDALKRGVIDFADVIYYVGTIVFFLLAARCVTEGRRGVSGNSIGLLAVLVICFSSCLIASKLPLRFDLTAEKLYTITDGSKKILSQLDTDVTFKYYVSSSSADMPVTLKTYAERVGNLLKEYERASNGHLLVETYDPKPDSDAEEWARRYGIEPQQTNPFGSPIFLGIVAVCGDNEQTLGVISPRTDATLEYDLTRLVTRVISPDKPVIGVLSALKGILPEKPNPYAMQFGQRPVAGWAVFSELVKDYDVREVACAAETIPDEIKTLVLVHPAGLSDKTLFAIDQFVQKGGKLVACVDPFSIKSLQDAEATAQMARQMPPMDSSTLGKLFTAWGITFDPQQLAGDYSAATRLNNGAGGVEENPYFLTLTGARIRSEDVTTAGLSEVMIPFGGALRFDPKVANLTFSPILTTANGHSCLTTDTTAIKYGQALRANSLADAQQNFTLAARLSGVFPSAFPKGLDGTNPVVTSSQPNDVFIFADTDFLSDAFAVNVMRTPWGTIPQLINDNLTLFCNVIEQFTGRPELVGIRARRPAERPFTVVNELEAKAMAQGQERQKAFEAELRETRQKLAALQSQKSGNERFILSPEQQEEILKLRKAEIETNRQLKNVRKALTAGIDSLGLRVKCVNILLVPILVVCYGLLRAWQRRRLAERHHHVD